MRSEGRALVLTLLCAAALAAGSGQADAQVADRIEPPAKPGAAGTEVTPYFAIGDDLAPGFGAAITFPWTRRFSIEGEASVGTDAARTSVSLLYAIPKLHRFGTYVAGGVGVQRDEFETGTALGFISRKKTEFAVNVGAGMTVPLNERWGYRVDFRWYNPDNEWPESWRIYNGITFGLRKPK